MKLHVFRSGREPDVFGFTPDATGMNLPAEYGPWIALKGAMEVVPTASLVGVGASGPVFAGIERDGFYVARSDVITRMTGIPTVE